MSASFYLMPLSEICSYHTTVDSFWPELENAFSLVSPTPQSYPLSVKSLGGKRRLVPSSSLPLATSDRGRVLTCSTFETKVRKMSRSGNLEGDN